MLTQADNPATQSIWHAIKNSGTDLLHKFELKIFPTKHLTPATLLIFKHYVEKYIPLDPWAGQHVPDYKKLAQEVIVAIHGDVWTSPDLLASQSTTTGTPEKSLMKGYNVEMLTYVDGACVDHMSNDEIVERIAAIESDIKALGKIEVESKAIKAQQAKMAETIELLVQFLDAHFEEASE